MTLDASEDALEDDDDRLLDSEGEIADDEDKDRDDRELDDKLTDNNDIEDSETDLADDNEEDGRSIQYHSLPITDEDDDRLSVMLGAEEDKDLSDGLDNETEDRLGVGLQQARPTK